MKKRLFLAILPLFALISCGSINDTPTNNRYNNDYELNQVLLNDLKDNEVIINLTSNGLYKGEKGSSSSNYYLENYVLLNLNVGDALPTKDDITSTVDDVEFVSWQFATSSGELAYVSEVQENQKYYQAYFNYVGDGEEDDYIPGSDLSSDEAPEDRTIYLKNEAKWSSVKAYYWNDYRNNSWPGTAMNKVNGTDDIYSTMISSVYNNIIFNNGSDQTADLKLYDNVNIYILSEDCSVTYGWYENNKITNVEITIDPSTSSEFYFRGSNNSWGVTNSLTKVDDDTYTITLDLAGGTEFKIATSDWSSEYTNIQGDAAGNFSGGHGEYSSNLRCDVSGNYTFTLTLSTGIINVTKN